MNIPVRSIKKWIDALRSGEYKQTKGCLENNDGNCCLGVAVRVIVPNKNLNLDGQYLYGVCINNQDQPEAPEWLKNIQYDFASKSGTGLIRLNDEANFTFDEIADLLQLVYIEKALG